LKRGKPSLRRKRVLGLTVRAFAGKLQESRKKPKRRAELNSEKCTLAWTQFGKDARRTQQAAKEKNPQKKKSEREAVNAPR